MKELDRKTREHLKQRKEKFLADLRGIVSERVVKAMADTPRELFVEPQLCRSAYDNRALPIYGYEKVSTISSPKVVAIMTDLLDPQPNERVLEVGAGTGYQAAVLSKLAGRVVTVEIFESLAQEAKQRLRKLEIDNVDIVVADGTISFTKFDTFDKIIVTASMFPSPYSPIFSLLNENGVLVAPIGGVRGDKSTCEIMRIRRRGDKISLEKKLPGFAFVPMGGAGGWKAYYREIAGKTLEHFFGKEGQEWSLKQGN